MPTSSNPDRVSLARQRELIAEYRKLAASVGPLKDRMRQIEAEVKAKMGEATYGTIGKETVVTWTTGTRESVDVKALRTEQPEIARKYLHVVPVRTFKIAPEPTA